MGVLASVLSRAVLTGFELLKEGKLPAIAKGGYYAMLALVLFMSTGYLASIDRRFESIEASLGKISDSVVKLNEVVTVTIETTAWHGKEIQRHSRQMEKIWEKVLDLEKRVRAQETRR